MGLPSKLKNFNVFDNGVSYAGKVPEIVLPKLTRKMESYQAGGMSGPVKVDFSNDEIVLEWSAGGLIVGALKQYAAQKHDAVQLRFAGAYQSDDTGEVDAVEIIIRGRHEEIDMGTVKIGEDTVHKYKTTCSYYKLSVNGEDIIEIDFMNGTCVIDGENVNEDIMTAIGL